MKKYQRFLSKNFRFLEVKFSIYLNRRVFVMKPNCCYMKSLSEIKTLIFIFFLPVLCFQGQSLHILFANMVRTLRT